MYTRSHIRVYEFDMSAGTRRRRRCRSDRAIAQRMFAHMCVLGRARSARPVRARVCRSRCDRSRSARARTRRSIAPARATVVFFIISA